MVSKRIALVALLVVLGSLHAPADAVAQTLWTAGTNNWNTAGNWSLGVPGSATDATIANGGTAQLLGPPTGAVRGLRVGTAAGAGNLLVDAATLNATQFLHVNDGSAGPASMTVRNGGSVSAPSTIVGFISNHNSSLLITGAGTNYNAASQFIVGNVSTATASLTVENGAVLTSGVSAIGEAAGSTGVAVVRGAGSQWSSAGFFDVGDLGAGTLTIENQGTVHVGTNLAINGSSNVNLNGGTLRFDTASGLNRLNYTAGTIKLAGDRLIPTDATIASIFGSSITSGKKLTVEGSISAPGGTFSVNGGTLTSLSNMTIGSLFGGVGTLNISGGGVVTNAGAGLGLFEESSGTSRGTVNVSGIGSTWTTGPLTVGGEGVGILNITNGASVVSSDVDMGFGFDGDAVDNVALVSGAGSSWTSNTMLSVGGLSSSTLTVQDQALVYANDLYIGPFSTVKLDGGTIRFNGFSRFDNGVNPGATGKFIFNSGTIQLAGNRSLGADAVIQEHFGSVPAIPAGKGLIVEGAATISSGLTLNGRNFEGQ